MKANIKRKKVVTALDYVGLNYLSNLVQRKEIQFFDNTFFEALVKEINRIRSWVGVGSKKGRGVFKVMCVAGTSWMYCKCKFK